MRCKEMGAYTLTAPIVFRIFIYRTVSTFVQKIRRDFLEHGQRIAESTLLRQHDNPPWSLTCLDFTGDGVGGEVNGGDVIRWSVGREESLAVR